MGERKKKDLTVEYSFSSSYEGSTGLMCFDFKISDNITLTVINIYGKIDSEDYATTTLHHILSNLTPVLNKYKKNRYFIIAGDFNVSTQLDKKHNGTVFHITVDTRLRFATATSGICKRYLTSGFIIIRKRDFNEGINIL